MHPVDEEDVITIKPTEQQIPTESVAVFHPVPRQPVLKPEDIPQDVRIDMPPLEEERPAAPHLSEQGFSPIDHIADAFGLSDDEDDPKLEDANELNDTIDQLKRELQDQSRSWIETVGYNVAGYINWLPVAVQVPLALAIGFGALIAVALLSAGIITVPVALGIAIPCSLISAAAIGSLAAVSNLKNMYKRVLNLSLQQLNAVQGVVIKFSNMLGRFRKIKEGFATQLDELRIQNTALTETIKGMTEEVGRLTVQIERSEDANEELTERLAVLNEEIKKLKAALKALEAVKKKLELETIPSLDKRIRDMGKEETKLKNIIRILNDTTTTLQAAVIDDGKREQFRKKVDDFLEDEGALTAAVSNLDELENRLRETTQKFEEVYQDQNAVLTELKALQHNARVITDAKRLLSSYHQFRKKIEPDLATIAQGERENRILSTLNKETREFHKHLGQVLDNTLETKGPEFFESSQKRLDDWHEDIQEGVRSFLRPFSASAPVPGRSPAAGSDDVPKSGARAGARFV